MEDESIVTFCSFTSATPEQAQQFLALTEGNVEQAVELFFTNPDLGHAAATSQPPQVAGQSTSQQPITIDDDDEDINDDDDDVQELSSRPVPRSAASLDDDEAIARRLQEEMYSGGASGPGGARFDEEGIRAPMARTTETLVGPGSSWQEDPNEMRAAIAEQMMARERRRAAPGIFNQRETPSIWANEDPEDPEAHRRLLSRATGGASDQTSKSNLLADLFRPPFDLISHLPFSTARDEGKENQKWILVNVQDPSIFDCQVLNRDIWKNQSIRDTVKEHFIFLQYGKDDSRGQEYISYYFSAMRDHDDAYPHIAIIDPRTGEQVKVWSGSPGPKASDFLMDLHEFLDRYSLNMEKKNPVQAQRKDRKKDVAQMSEDEMLQMAMQNSLSEGKGQSSKEIDPDALTKPSASSSATLSDPEPMDVEDTNASANGANASNDTPFAMIPAVHPHQEPPSTDPKETTRIQFRFSGGRVVRRFSLSDPVQRIFEWLKAAPIEGHTGEDFELISMGKNLIDVLEIPIGEAGLKNGTVMVEFVEDV